MFNNKENSLKSIKVSCEQKEPFLRSKSFVTRNIIKIKVGNDIETGSRKSFCRFRSENDLKLHTLLIKFLYWTSDQKAIKLNNVGHI